MIPDRLHIEFIGSKKLCAYKRVFLTDIDLLTYIDPDVITIS
jgi:hypothetical protein